MQLNGHQSPTSSGQEPDLQSQVPALLVALGDTPETVITRYALQSGQCSVLVAGHAAHFDALIVQTDDMADEPTAYGESAEAIASLLSLLEGWGCLNVPVALADDLIEPVAEAADAVGIRMLDDVFHTLSGAPRLENIEGARILTVDDLDLIARADPDFIGTGIERLASTLEWGHVAGVIRDGALVSIAYTYAQSERYADIGVATHPAFRQQGFASATGALVAQAIQASGRTPVWSTGGTNLASLKAAAHIGFVETSRRVYLIPEFADDSTARDD